MQWVLEIGLMGLLIATLIHAVRLGRALALLKHDRGPLEDLVAGFAASTREAQTGIEHLRHTADGAARRIAQQIETATGLRDDLTYLIERAERSADRLDQTVRSNRSYESRPAEPRPYEMTNARPTAAAAPPEPPKIRSQAERDLLQALRLQK